MNRKRVLRRPRPVLSAPICDIREGQVLFKIECGNCGRTVEWKTGSQLGRMEIEVSGSVVICACGHGVANDAGHNSLREFHMPAGEEDGQ